MKKPNEQLMHLRRLERLDRLNFFMKDVRVPGAGRQIFALSETHNLLAGFFHNSQWQVAWFCFKQAFGNTARNIQMRAQLFYYDRILRLSEAQSEARICGDIGEPGECPDCGSTILCECVAEDYAIELELAKLDIHDEN